MVCVCVCVGVHILRTYSPPVRLRRTLVCLSQDQGVPDIVDGRRIVGREIDERIL